MNKRDILLNLNDILKNRKRSKGIRYLFHLTENANREISYLALFHAVNDTGYEGANIFSAQPQIKQCDTVVIKEVYKRIFNINSLIAHGNSNDAIIEEKRLLENYLQEVLSSRYIKYFHDEFTKCRNSIKEVVRLGMKILHAEQPDLYDIVKHSLVQRWNSIGVYL